MIIVKKLIIIHFASVSNNQLDLRKKIFSIYIKRFRREIRVTFLIDTNLAIGWLSSTFNDAVRESAFFYFGS